MSAEEAAGNSYLMRIKKAVTVGIGLEETDLQRRKELVQRGIFALTSDLRKHMMKQKKCVVGEAWRTGGEPRERESVCVCEILEINLAVPIPIENFDEFYRRLVVQRATAECEHSEFLCANRPGTIPICTALHEQEGDLECSIIKNKTETATLTYRAEPVSEIIEFLRRELVVICRVLTAG
jgi:hypothetical protein